MIILDGWRRIQPGYREKEVRFESGIFMRSEETVSISLR